MTVVCIYDGENYALNRKEKIMRIRKLLPTAIAFVILTSCASQENGGNTKQADIENIGTTPVSQIWDGYEELQGRQYGNSFTLPEKIEPVSVEELYSFRMTLTYDEKPHEELAKQFYKYFFGDSYKEEYVTVKAFNVLYNAPDGAYGAFGSTSPVNASRDSKFYPTSELLGVYDVIKDGAVSMELADSGCTVSEATEAASRLVNKALAPLYPGYDFVPDKVRCIDSIMASDDNPVTSAQVHFVIKYKGLMLEDRFTPLFKTEDKGFYQVMTNYTPAYVDVDIVGKDSISLINNNFSNNTPKPEKLEKIISLKQAVELLERELAPQSGYRFNEVCLIYCNKVTSPTLIPTEEMMGKDIILDFPEENARMYEEFGEVIHRYDPTWCFYYGSEEAGASVKVNARTGEITIDQQVNY